jgi:tetratricopeptide (TPR) repeat protein
VRTTLLICLVIGLTGCSLAAQKCLETPISSKVSDESVEQCRQALKTDLDRKDVFHRFVGLLRVRNHYNDVVTWSTLVLEHDESRTDALYNLAYGLRKSGRCDDALKKYQAYADKNKDDPDPYYGIGLCQEELGNVQAATEAYTTYVNKEQRKDQQEWVERARARIAALASGGIGMTQPAPAPTPAAPGVAPAPAAPAPAAPAPSAPPPAPAAVDCSAHQQAFKADPFNTDAYDKYAECAAQAGQHDDIIKYMRIALRDNPDFSRGWLHMAKAFRAKGNEPQAKSAFAKACSAGVPEACGQ